MENFMLQDFLFSLPLIVVALGALVFLVLEVSLKADWPRAVLAVWFVTSALGFAAIGFYYASPEASILGGLMYADRLSSFLQILLLSAAFLVLTLGAGRLKEEGVDSPGEYYVLILFVTLGAMVFGSAAELVTMFIGLELMSLALYCLCGSAIKRRPAVEGALKYFILGSFCSAFLLYGIALLYGVSGSTHIMALREGLSQAGSPLFLFALGLMLVGLVFKIGAVPFHFWVADAYQGAPTMVTAFMACAVKIAAFGAALRVVWGAFGQAVLFWSGAVWLIAVLTMTLGNLAALRQRSMKRMLAYSSIAQVGYMVVSFSARGGQVGGGAALLYYLAVYSLMTLGAFGVVLAVTSPYGESRHPDDITRFNGLGWSQPFLGLVMALFMLSLAGLPPGMGGLLGKFYIFNAAVRAGYVWLVVAAVINSALSCYYYLRVIVAMYFIEAPIELSEQGVRPVEWGLCSVLSVCALGVVLLGVFPSWLYESAMTVMVGF